MKFTQNNIKAKQTKHINKPDYILFLMTSTLIIIGVIFSYSLSVYTVLQSEVHPYYYVIRQGGFAFVSITIMWYLAHVDSVKIVGYAGLFFFFFFLATMVIMALFPGSYTSSSGGASRWIKLPGFSISPIEFFKIGFVYFLANSFYRNLVHKSKDKLIDEFLLLLPYVFILVFIAIFVAIAQKDFGSMMLLSAIFIVLLVFANRSVRLFLVLLSGLFGAVLLLVLFTPYRANRILGWWGGMQDSILPFLPAYISIHLRVDNAPDTYQLTNSLRAIGNGDLFGQGIGLGNSKLGFLSEVHTDFVLAGISEEVGFVGVSLVVALFVAIIIRILSISQMVKNSINHLFVLGIGLMFAISFILNAYGISGIFPIKGISVPFLSYGGSSLLASCIAVGLVLSISKDVRYEPK
jgi:cell division protein FtsW